MLDKRTARMLKQILVVCGDGSYKIIEIADLIKSMMPRYNLDAEAIAQIIKFLADNEMIDIKYFDDKVYCIAVLPKGRIYDESRHIKTREFRMGKRLAIVTVLASFLGAVVGAVLVHFIL
jgi:predicted transcriptional regulator